MIRLAVALSLILAASPSLANDQLQSQPTPSSSLAEPAESTVHRHLGFALRLDGGIGYMGSTASMATTSPGGASGFMGIVIGAAVAENLILGGDMWGTGMFGGSNMMQSGGTGYGLWAVGPNLTYYFMPANVYVSATPSVTALTSMSHYTTTTSGWTNAGFGFKAAVGKEWWVGDHWGLGIAGQFFAAWNGSQGTPSSTWTTLAGGLALSATYN